MKKIAIVTGASSGLGRQYVHGLMKYHKELDEIWVIARRKYRLDELAEKYPSKIKVLPYDLSKAETFDIIKAELEKEKPNIKILINNAGVDKTGNVSDIPLKEQLNIIDVNSKAYLAMAHIALPYMQENSFMIFVCSVSSFAPNPHLAVYSGSKAFVKYFGEALRQELKPRKINVLTLCPGNMDTEMNPKNSANDPTSIVHKLPYIDLDVIVRKSLKKAEKGDFVYTPGVFYKFFRVICKVIPHRIMVIFTRV